MRRSIYLMVACQLGSLLLGSAALAGDERSGRVDRERLELALSGRERVPTKKELLLFGPGVGQALREIVERPSHRALARTRALAVLRAFPSSETTATLKREITLRKKASRGLALLDLRQALVSYAVAAGPSSLELCRSFLTHPNMDVRYAAVTAVAGSRHPAARQTLEKRLAHEPEAMVRHRLTAQITRLRALKQPAKPR